MGVRRYDNGGSAGRAFGVLELSTCSNNPIITVRIRVTEPGQESCSGLCLNIEQIRDLAEQLNAWQRKFPAPSPKIFVSGDCL